MPFKPNEPGQSSRIKKAGSLVRKGCPPQWGVVIDLDVDALGLWQGYSAVRFVLQARAEVVAHGGRVVIGLPLEIVVTGPVIYDPYVGEYTADGTSRTAEIGGFAIDNDLALGYGEGADGTSNDEITGVGKEVPNRDVGRTDGRAACPSFSTVAPNEDPVQLITGQQFGRGCRIDPFHGFWKANAFDD